VSVLVRAGAAPVFVATNVFCFALFYRGKDACGIIMTVCPSANVRFRRHTNDIFIGVKNCYDT
jgi:hypothetical protein